MVQAQSEVYFQSSHQRIVNVFITMATLKADNTKYQSMLQFGKAQLLETGYPV